MKSGLDSEIATWSLESHSLGLKWKPWCHVPDTIELRTMMVLVPCEAVIPPIAYGYMIGYSFRAGTMSTYDKMWCTQAPSMVTSELPVTQIPC